MGHRKQSMAADGGQADAQPQPVGLGFVLEYSAQRLAKFGAVVLGVAWLLSSEDPNRRRTCPWQLTDILHQLSGTV